MKTIRAASMWNNHTVMEYEVNGKDFSVTGDFYYNKKKARFEHVHVGPRGGQYLIIWLWR